MRAAIASKPHSFVLIEVFIAFSRCRATMIQLPVRYPRSMRMLTFRLLLHWCAAQEVIFFLFFFEIFRAFGVVPFHLHALFLGKLRQVADEAHQLPAILLRSMRAAKRGHPGEAYSIFDNPEKFAVRELLRFVSTQVRRLRIKITAYRRVSAAVVGVADGAMIREM